MTGRIEIEDPGSQSQPARSFRRSLATLGIDFSTMTIEDRVAALKTTTDRAEAVRTISLFLTELEKGTIRAAERDDMGAWKANPWVKEGILAAFRFGVLAEFASGALSFVDKDTIPARRFKAADSIRIVPGGSSIRRGTFIGKGVVMMPPAF